MHPSEREPIEPAPNERSRRLEVIQEVTRTVEQIGKEAESDLVMIEAYGEKAWADRWREEFGSILDELDRLEREVLAEGIEYQFVPPEWVEDSDDDEPALAETMEIEPEGNMDTIPPSDGGEDHQRLIAEIEQAESEELAKARRTLEIVK